jgi:uncharacterized phage-associated protein
MEAVMTKAIDVAEYILQRCGPLSTVKLQKLVYYAQAWHLVWNDEPLFNEEIQAWVGGPVILELYEKHKGVFKVTLGYFNGNPNSIHQESKKTINKVIEFYGNKDAQWLSDLTHMEDPWKIARIGLSDRERGSNIISLASMQEYYSSISIQ